MNLFRLIITFVPVRTVTRQVRFFFLFLMLMVTTGYASAAPVPVKTPEAKTVSDAKKREQNRQRLMAKAKKHVAAVPAAPEQKRQEMALRLAERARNRERLAMHARWSPGSLGRSEALWRDVQDDAAIATRRTQKSVSKLRTVIHRLESQLGKPYLWGGNSPSDGFDCSGLVFYAFNDVLDRKLPRTANGMFQDNALKPVHQEKLRRGDLVFFNINQRPGADHVGVYLGDGRFIEAPRTGLTIRISQLSDNFWQSHYLGARRVL